MWTYEKKARYASCTYKKPPKTRALHTNSLIFAYCSTCTNHKLVFCASIQKCSDCHKTLDKGSRMVYNKYRKHKRC